MESADTTQIPEEEELLVIEEIPGVSAIVSENFVTIKGKNYYFPRDLQKYVEILTDTQGSQFTIGTGDKLIETIIDKIIAMLVIYDRLSDDMKKIILDVKTVSKFEATPEYNLFFKTCSRDTTIVLDMIAMCEKLKIHSLLNILTLVAVNILAITPMENIRKQFDPNGIKNDIATLASRLEEYK